MKTVAILAFDGMFDSSLAVTLDILTSAQRIHNIHCKGVQQVKTCLCAVGHRRLSTGAGLTIAIDHNLNDLTELDILIVPGLGIADPEHMDNFLTSREAHKAMTLLKDHHKNGTTITASCSATFLLAEAGFFDCHTATTSWWLADMFRTRYPHIKLQTEQMLITGPGLICAGAAMAQADLVLTVVAQLYGEETARLTANYLLIDRREFQSQYIMSGMLTHRHPEVAKAERWIRANMTTEFSMADLARAAGLSSRTLERRIKHAVGVGPLKFVRQLRLEQAVHLLETTPLSFETIAMDVGYRNSSSLRRLLHQRMGKTPRQIRLAK